MKWRTSLAPALCARIVGCGRVAGFAAFALFAALTLNVASAQDAAVSARPGWLPASWQVGGDVDGHRIEAIEVHPEFVRVVHAAGGFEVVHCEPGGDPSWCRGPLRVQPAQGRAFDEAELRRRLAELGDGSGAAVAPAGTPTAPLLHSRGAGDVDSHAPRDRTDHGAYARALARWIVLLALVALLAWRLTADAPWRRRWVWLVLAWTVAMPLLGRILHATDAVPIEAATLLHEGWDVYVATTLASPWPADAPARLLLGPGEGLVGIAVANHLLQVLYAGLLVGLLAGMGHPWWRSVALAAIVALSANAMLAFGSETETAEALVLWLFGAIGVAAARDRRLGLGWRYAGILAIVLCATHLDRRSEYIAAAAIGVGAALESLWLPDRARSAALRVIRGAWALVGRIPWPIWLAALLALSRFNPSDTSQLQVSALASVPLRLQWLRMPLDLAGTAPLLLSVLWVLGVAYVVLHADARRWWWLVVMTLAQYNVYLYLGHGDLFELQRYIANLMPAVALVAALGWRWFDGWSADWRAVSPARRNGVLLGLAVLACVDGRIGDAEGKFGFWLNDVRMKQNPQLAAHFWHRAMEAEPTCVFVTRSARGVDDEGRVTKHALVVFGRNLGGPRVCEPTPAALAKTLAGLDAPPTCLRAFAGLDCNLAEIPDCGALGSGPDLLSSESPSAPMRASHFGRIDGAFVRFWVRDLNPAWRPGGATR